MANKKTFLSIILMLFVCSYNGICQSTPVTAESIVKEMQAQYSKASSYEDEGIVEEVMEDDLTNPVTILSFKTYFSRPSLFRFEWTDERIPDKDKNFSIVWFYKDKANFSHGGDLQPTGKTPNFYQAILGAKPISRDAVYDIPVLLNGEFGKSWLEEVTNLSILSEEKLEGEDCYVVKAEFSDLPSVDMWISKRDFLLRKIRKRVNDTYLDGIRKKIKLNQGLSTDIFNYKVKPKTKSHGIWETLNNEFNRRGAIITVVAILLLLLFSFLSISKRIRRIIVSVVRESFMIEFFVPALILIGLLHLEAFVTNKQNISHAFRYEFLLICLIYMIVLFAKLVAKHRKHSKKETELWFTYSKVLKEAKTQVIAFNTRDFTNFFQPLGLRYFLEQIDALSSNPNNSNINRQRIIVINEKTVYEDWIVNALMNNYDLEEQAEIFYNLVLLHELCDIELYLVTKKDVLKELGGHYFWNHWMSRWKYRSLDRLIIDGKCWHPTNTRISQHYKFDEDKENAVLIQR